MSHIFEQPRPEVDRVVHARGTCGGSEVASADLANVTALNHHIPQDNTTEKFVGKIAVVTGGTSGIGAAPAQRFVAEGAYVFITGRRQAILDAAVQRIGQLVTGVPGDVASLLNWAGCTRRGSNSKDNSTSSSPMLVAAHLRRWEPSRQDGPNLTTPRDRALPPAHLPRASRWLGVDECNPWYTGAVICLHGVPGLAVETGRAAGLFVVSMHLLC